MPWYLYTPITIPRDPLNPNNYTLVVGLPPACPGLNNFICAIQSAGVPQPIINQSLCEEMALALVNKIDTTNVKLKPTP